MADIVLRLLRALATPLIFLAVIHALSRFEVPGRKAARLAFLLLTNTLAAIFIGITVASVMGPGRGVVLTEAEPPAARAFEPGKDLLSKIPESILGPLVNNDILPLVIVAVALGVAMRLVRKDQARRKENGWETLYGLVSSGLDMTVIILGWVLALVPFAVFAAVAKAVGTQGLAAFKALGLFSLAVLIALALQALYYAVRVRLGSWVRPWDLVRGCLDALTTAFGTASSTATTPVTYACMRDKVRVREENAALGTMVGANFNNDGTALYEAMAALFVAQSLGMDLSLGQQVTVVLMSIVASVGAAGIPEAGLVTMMAVFSSLGLPVEVIPLLLTVDWFLDRCRTCINVGGDMTVSCLLDGRKRHAAAR
jgi:DAACS family dicarboxylate/amino acid:cation (Na+ or H+) symporter